MSEIYSNSFSTTVNKTTTSTSEIVSNQFTATINKTTIGETSNNTQVTSIMELLH